jgi:hypothetical protein
MPKVALKAEERPCKGCEAMIPPQPSGPGRPKVFCSRECRRRYFHEQEQAEVERQYREQGERQLYARDKYFHGAREAKRRARERRKGHIDG